MTLEDSSQRNLDKIGGIIAAAAFGVCLVANVWQWARHRCHPLGALCVFLVLRVVGWLLAFIGAIRDDQLLNKRGYIVNSLAFWLMMLTGLLLLARWDAIRRGAKWGARSWGGTGAAALLCVGFGALDAAGQITWLNNPGDGPAVTLSVAAVGLLVLAGIYALTGIFFNYREALFYQRASVRWSFFLTAALLVGRCVFWMLVGLNIVKFDEPKRLIFLFCLTTTFEIGAAAIWGFMPVAKRLRSTNKGAGSEMESLKPESVIPIRPLPADTAIPAHTLNARPSGESEFSEAESEDGASAHHAMAAHHAPAPATKSGLAYGSAHDPIYGSAYGGAPGGQPVNTNPHNSYYRPAPTAGPNANPWAGASATNISFVAPGQPQYTGTAPPHTTFVKSPYPQTLVTQTAPAAQAQSPYVDRPSVAYTADYFRGDDDESSSRSSIPPNVATMQARQVPEGTLPGRHPASSE
ncbi:hypothetical protein LPJ61_002454 [Coemansia biformis]|uniref:Uncharacterized protein n=1 Tax=Coemansia biformis TaxID=1286918 RepID=A0A9W7YFS8_9FUNG|nr:hypothetical protein LPJ61_002454 [Coemansia biformis]